jgi:hypothetical protein
MRYICANITAVKKQELLHILNASFSLSYPACQAHAQYCSVIGGLSGCIIFSTVRHKGMIFGKRVTEYNMRVLIISTTFVSNISHSKKNLIRYNQKCYVGLQVPSTHYSCQILKKLEFSCQIFNK